MRGSRQPYSLFRARLRQPSGETVCTLLVQCNAVPPSPHVLDASIPYPFQGPTRCLLTGSSLPPPAFRAVVAQWRGVAVAPISVCREVWVTAARAPSNATRRIASCSEHNGDASGSVRPCRVLSSNAVFGRQRERTLVFFLLSFIYVNSSAEW